MNRARRGKPGRLSGQGRRTISRATYDGLLEVLPAAEQVALRKAVIMPEAARALREHRRWVRRSLARFGLAHIAHDTWETVATWRRDFSAQLRQRRGDLSDRGRRQLEEESRYPLRCVAPRTRTKASRVARLGWGAIDTLTSLLAIPDARGELTAFESWGRKRGVSYPRHILALLRIVEPLTAVLETPIERTTMDLAPLRQGGYRATHLKRYVKAAIVREQVLLDRAPDENEAQRLALVFAEQRPGTPEHRDAQRIRAAYLTRR